MAAQIRNTGPAGRRRALGPQVSGGVTGAGIAILCLVVFATYLLYRLIPAASTLSFSSIVTLVAVDLALRYESRAAAVLLIVGGFAPPLFPADSLPSRSALLA